MGFKILILVDVFGTGAVGGAGKVFYQGSRELLKKGHEVHVICRWGEEQANESGIFFHPYLDISGGQLKKARHYRDSIKRLYQQVSTEYQPDLIIVHSCSAALGVESQLQESGIPVIYYFHSPWHLEYEIITGQDQRPVWHLKYWPVSLLSAERKRREKSCLRSVSGIVTLSEFMQGQMMDCHPETQNTPKCIIPGGADPETFFPVADAAEKTALRKKLVLPEEDFIIISTRRLVPRTGVDLLIEAFNQVKQQADKPLKLIVTGKGEWEGKLQNLARSLGLAEQVVFTGYVAEKELAEYYRVSDLFVMPSRHLEGFGLSTVEAMASGLPVIGTNVGGTPEILSRISDDLIIPECSSEAIAEKLTQYSNPDKAREASEKASQCAKAYFSWEKHVESLLKFFRNIS